MGCNIFNLYIDIINSQGTNNKSKQMSCTINAVKLFQLSMNYDRHRLKLNRIKSKSSPVLKKQKEQMTILTSRHSHKQYNSRFKYQQNLNQINRKNVKILDKLEGLSKVKRPNSNTVDRLRNSMVLNRSASKMEGSRYLEIENQRFLKKLFSVKSTINNNKQNNSFYDHQNRSQMLSRFKKNERGISIPKSECAIQKRVKLQPLHKKLCIVESRVKEVRSVKVSQSPLKLSMSKIMKMNPEKL